MNPVKTHFAKIRALSFRHFALVIYFLAALVIDAGATARVGPVIGAALGLAAFALGSASVTKREAALFANNFGILNNTILLHDAFSMFWLALLPIANLILDVSDPVTGAREAKPGDTITIKDWRQNFTAYSVGAGGYNSPSNIAVADTQVTLPSVAKAVSVALSAAEFRLLALGSSGGADYDAFKTKIAGAMQQALGLAIVTDFFAQITAANFANYTVSAAGTFARTTEIAMDGKLFNRSVPRVGAQTILNGAAYLEWVGDHVPIQTNNPTAATLPRDLLIDDGVQSSTTPFAFRRTSLAMPADADRGFAITKTGMVGAFRIPTEATYEQDPVSLSVVIEPKTKVPLLARLWKNAQTGGIQLDLASIWKFQPGQVEAVERIVSVAPVG